MTPDRFADLAAAYGGRFERWPDGERDAAVALLRREPALARHLAEASTLDDLLARDVVPGPGSALAARVVAAAAAERSRLRRFRLWLSSLGAAATVAVGVAAGAASVLLFDIAEPPPTTDSNAIEVLGTPVGAAANAATPTAPSGAVR